VSGQRREKINGTSRRDARFSRLPGARGSHSTFGSAAVNKLSRDRTDSFCLHLVRRCSRVFPVRKGPRFATLIGMVFVAGAWRAGLGGLSDNSFFCHLRTGQWMLEHGLPRRDLYSFVAAGAPWVAESWLADLLYGLINRSVGPLGLRVFTAFTSAAIAILAWSLALRLARDRVYAALLTLAAVGASFTLWSARPLLLGLFALSVLIWIVEAPQSRVGRHPLCSIPPLIWLWANIHGSFILGVGYLVLHCLGRRLDDASSWTFRDRQLLSAGVIALGLSLLNPYGAGLLLAPLNLIEHHGVLRNVIEWRPLDFRQPDFRGLTYSVWLVIFVGCAIKGHERITRRDVLVCVPFLLAGLWAQRNIALASLVTLPVAARLIATAAERADAGHAINWGVGALIAALAIGWTLRAVVRPDFDFQGYPVGAMRALAAKRLLGRRLLSTDDWNGYIILRWWPHQYVFMDDRYEIYPSAVATALIRLKQGENDWRQVLDTYSIEVLVWPPRSPTIAALKHQPGWILIYHDSTAVVYAKRTVVRDPSLGSAANAIGSATMVKGEVKGVDE
jgi:hypothetical protein